MKPSLNRMKPLERNSLLMTFIESKQNELGRGEFSGFDYFVLFLKHMYGCQHFSVEGQISASSTSFPKAGFSLLEHLWSLFCAFSQQNLPQSLLNKIG